jgi:hypothetical protein
MIEDLPVSLSYEIASPSADKTEPKRSYIINASIPRTHSYAIIAPEPSRK